MRSDGGELNRVFATGPVGVGDGDSVCHTVLVHKDSDGFHDNLVHKDVQD